MQHPDEGTVHAWIDGELSPEQASEITTHISGCPECAAMVAEARGLVAASTRILTALDDVPGGVIPSVPDIAPTQIVRRRWYQRTDLRTAAALLFVAGASVLVARRGVDKEASRAMIAATEKGQPAPAVGSETTAARATGTAQQIMADATSSLSATTAPNAAEQAAAKPLAARELSRKEDLKSGVSGPTDQSLQPKARLKAQSSRLQERDEPQLSKEDAARRRMADVANAPPAAPLSRVDAAAPPTVAAPAERRSNSAAAGVVEGQVTDKTSGGVVADASVVVQGTTLQATTGKDGRFRIENVPEGTQRLLVRRIGYQAETIPLATGGRGTVAANVELAPTQTALSEVVVTSADVAPARAPATLGAAIGKAIPTAHLKVVRVDSTGVTKRIIYEVSKGIEVTLIESPADTGMEQDATARQKTAAPQSSAAGVEAKPRVNVLRGQAADAVISAPTVVLNSISWTERGRRFILAGRLTTKDLEALKTRLMQMRQ